MPRTVTYRIFDQPDGRFGVVAVMEPDRVYRRGGFATLAEAEDWVEGLRALMAACGAPVVAAPSGADFPVRNPTSDGDVADPAGEDGEAGPPPSFTRQPPA